MIKYINGDMLASSADIICHQVEYNGEMDKGLAERIKNKHPEVFRNYKTMCMIKSPSSTVGYTLLSETNGGKLIANLFSQLYMRGERSEEFIDYVAFRKCLQNLKKEIERLSSKEIKVIAFPYEMGCAFKNYKWEYYISIIEEELSDYDIEIWQI